MKSHAIEVIVRGLCHVEGQILLCRNAGGRIAYLPGGHVEFGEPARRALEREIYEELGLDSRAGAFLGGVEHTFNQNGTPRSEINLVFALAIGALTPGQPVIAEEPHLRFVWTARSELRSIRLEPAVLHGLIPEWINGNGATWTSSGSLDDHEKQEVNHA